MLLYTETISPETEPIEVTSDALAARRLLEKSYPSLPPSPAEVKASEHLFGSWKDAPLQPLGETLQLIFL